MPSKRSRKVKKRQKALQRRRQQQPTSKRRLLTQIPPESADQLAMTTTGEIMQPIRLHYEVQDGEQLRATFSTLRCLDYDAPRTRWVWLYTDEARTLSFKTPAVADHTVLGEFVFKGTAEVVLNLRSLERATQAIEFFDKHIPRTVVRVTAVTVSNRFLRLAEASTLTSLDQYFERADVVVKDPVSLVETLKDMASNIPDERERLAAVRRYMDEKAKQPVPAMERFPFDYEDYDLGGIGTVEARFVPHSVIAMQHWQGNTDYTRHDMIQDMLRAGTLPTGETDTMSLTEPSVDASLPRLNR
jgi:predicted HD phosphohydrolase